MMHSTRSLLLGAVLAFSSAFVPFSRAPSAHAATATASAPFKITALRVQKQNIDDPKGIHDLTPVIPSGATEYYREYVTVVRHVAASPMHVEFWIVEPSSNPNVKSRVLAHHSATFHFPEIKHHGTFSVELSHEGFTLGPSTLTLAVLLKGQITYGGATRTKTVAAIICDIQKIHCNL